MSAAAAAASLSVSPATQATPARHLATPWRTRKPTVVVDAIPAEAAAWLRAHFDWTFGAVWVACERWGVGAETVVAWAETLRCGSAVAGLRSGKERKWILEQLSDPDQQPTAVEMAMARADFAWGLVPGEAHRAQAARVAIRSIDDAIALIETRLAEADDAGESARESGGDLRRMLLDDLQVLRVSQRRGERLPGWQEPADTPTDTPDDLPLTAPAREPDREEREHTMATHATHAKGAPPYQTREATCDYCGSLFTSRKYTTGWTRFCSARCSARARHFNPETLPRRPAIAAPAAAIPTTQTAHVEVAAAPAEPPIALDVAPASASAEVTTPAEQAEQDAAAAIVLDTSDEAAEPSEASETVAAADDDATDETPDETEKEPPDIAAGVALLAKVFGRFFGPAPQPQFPMSPPPRLMLPQMAGGIGGVGPYHVGSGRPFAQTGAQVQPAPTDTDADDETETPPQPPTYPLLRQLLDRLPPSDATWTRSAYERWLRAFTATLQLDVVIVDDDASSDTSREA